MINLVLGVTSICLVQFMNKSISLSNLLIIHSLVVFFLVHCSDIRILLIFKNSKDINYFFNIKFIQ